MAVPIDSFEIFVNEHSADLQVFRVTLTILILRLVGQHPPTAEAGVRDLKNSVLGAIGRIKLEPGEPGAERMKQLTAMRADKFFVELEQVVSETLHRMAGAERN
jgi:hypothetical protein